MAGLPSEVVRHALQTARKLGYAELELEVDGEAFRARLDPVAKAPKPVAATESADPPDLTIPVKSTHVGYFRAGKGLEVGSRVEKGKPVATILALGLSNEIEAPISGEVTEVLVEDGKPVEFGQVLARIREGS